MSKLRFLAEYPRFGDPDHTFMHRVLQTAKDAGQIHDFRVLDILHNPNGYTEMEIILFTVDVEIQEGDEWWGLEYDDTKPKAEGLLNEIVHDSDVNVRYVGIPDPEAEHDAELAVSAWRAKPVARRLHLGPPASEHVEISVAKARALLEEMQDNPKLKELQEYTAGDPIQDEGHD